MVTLDDSLTAPPRGRSLDSERLAVDRARDYIHEHYASKVTAAQLAQVSGLSRYHLVRSFKKAFGLPPHAYLTQVRIFHACAQLQAGQQLRDLEVGFADQSHLTRQFKRAIGVTPAAYARRIRVGRDDE